LINVHLGDLGFTAKEVEEALERNFELASRWDCVLLLDEADVFLASRAQAVTGADLNRNALVAGTYANPA
jgi:transcriptional regulator of acetoin/glycerol metabolism